MNTEWVDYYLVLELEFGCSEEEIKKNYRTLMKKYHPDSEFANEDKSREVNLAYEVLGDPDKRAEYDATYLQYKNGEFQEETQEMPKYTHEEMHEAFTEEEIRFAKRAALQQTISETLENAKIIIDAKNELLFAAFNDTYDKDTYKEEYKQFCTITKEFITNLQSLISEADEFGLDEEINTINQVIAFLGEVMESIPETLKEAKRKVKIEIIKEQLQDEAEQAISNAEMVRNEFVSLYAKVYSENIGKEEFKMYYNILRLGVIDALSQLDELYDLLKKAKLDEIYKNVGILIGKLNQSLKLYSGKYKVAREIGKREYVKEKINNSMLSFTEYKTKILSIMQGIIDEPTLENAKLRVEEGRLLTQSFENDFEQIAKENFDDSVFADSAKKIYRDALKIYTKRNDLHDKLTKIFDKTKVDKVGDEQVELLTEDVEISSEEIEAIKLLHEVYILLGQDQEYRKITNNDLKKLIKNVNGYLNKSKELQGYLDSMYKYIESIVEAYEIYCAYVKDHSLDGRSGLDHKVLSDKLDSCQFRSALFSTLANFTAACFMGGCLFFGDSETMKELQIASETLLIPQNLFDGVVMSLASFIPFRVIASSYKERADMLIDKVLLYRKLASSEQNYQNLLNGCNSYLQKVYEKALKV